MTNKYFFFLFFFSFFVSGAAAQHVSENAKHQKLIYTVDSILQSQVNRKLIPGAVVEIKKGNEILCRKAFGFAERNDYHNKPLAHPEKMTPGDLFDLASLTKVVGTTTAIMLLVDRGQIHVDDPVSKYIPAFGSGDKRQITIRNLLTHTAGLITWYPLFYRASGKEETYRLIHELPLAYPVGKIRKYSDLGFILLGEIVEKVSGMPLNEFDSLHIFQPLGMQHTTYNPLADGRFKEFAATSHGNPFETRMVHDSSLGYVFKEIDPNQWNGWRHYNLRGEVNDGNAWYALNGISGHAGLFSTAADLQKLVDMLKNDGKAGNKQFISKETLELFLTKDAFKNGLGWMMDTEDSFMNNAPEGTFGHTGFTGTSIVIVPSLNISVILLINRQNMGLLDTGFYYNVNPVRKEIFNAVLNYCK
ncbi:MAG TPA: serine hydrolase [Hanamia sp.]|nr:serine hydrolase [Hanamia sp.]